MLQAHKRYRSLYFFVVNKAPEDMFDKVSETFTITADSFINVSLTCLSLKYQLHPAVSGAISLINFGGSFSALFFVKLELAFSSHEKRTTETKNNKKNFNIFQKDERKTGLEPATYSLGSCRSTR